MRIARLLVLCTFGVAAHVAAAQNPLADWVKKNRPDYKVRSNPNSFPLVGYVYPDDRLTPPPIGRTQNCLNDPLRTKVLTNDAELIASGESKVLNATSASYYFARQDKSKIQIGGALGSILASFGIGKEGQDTQTVQYDAPIYIGFIPAHYCKATDDYRQKC